MFDEVSFQVSSSTENYPASALGKYYPYWIDKDAKIKNQNFDEFSGKILDLKNKDKSVYIKGVKYFVDDLLFLIESKIPENTYVEISVVPSSSKGDHSPGLLYLVQELCKKNRNLIDKSTALQRTKTIKKLTSGGDRSYSNQIATLLYRNPQPKSQFKIILDDVATSGNSLAASFYAVAQYSKLPSIWLFSIGRTAGG